MSKTKKLYILYDMGTCYLFDVILELPKDVTGGPWYVEQEFDMEFVDVISHFVEKFLPEDVHFPLMIDS